MNAYSEDLRKKKIVEAVYGTYWDDTNCYLDAPEVDRRRSA
jgi:hypothetical protein